MKPEVEEALLKVEQYGETFVSYSDLKLVAATLRAMDNALGLARQALQGSSSNSFQAGGDRTRALESIGELL